jgi:hypothetical protein
LALKGLLADEARTRFHLHGRFDFIVILVFHLIRSGMRSVPLHLERQQRRRMSRRRLSQPFM